MYYQLKRTQDIPASIEEVWEFMSSPKNLKRITPPSMGFDIVAPSHNNAMYAGCTIGYIVKPVLGIKTHWLTEITHVKEGEFFIDEQRVGPYALWHHQHILEEIDGGVRMYDIVTYALPLGILGRIAHTLFVKKKLQQIFAFRVKAVEEIFGVFSPK